ncbi:MAG TPA: arginine deiminase-related protein [Flavobacteriaceae bacterium]|nr:arginine deiminase-related protein [Flavobacteriaceae bacterium]HJO70987.1 arginine deiminase-related protein [Flavobacteriaceae bacterium]
MNHFSSHILMVYPKNFRSNVLTIDDNTFQKSSSNLSNNEIKNKAIEEFELLYNKIQSQGIKVTVFKDSRNVDTPDAVFPNNWISFHKDNKAITYPMFAKNRRLERTPLVIECLNNYGKNISIDYDYSNFENDNLFLEGTGSLVLDRLNKIAYCSLSQRSNEELVNRFCIDMGYNPVVFKSYHQNKPIYHTNVLLSICNKFSVVCLESIINKKERQSVTDSLISSGLEIIDIDINQMSSFGANCIQLNGNKGPVLVMSSKAYSSFTNNQLDIIQKNTQIIHSSLENIENNSGGSARCMIAEVF